jgi:uncharacterized protein
MYSTENLELNLEKIKYWGEKRRDKNFDFRAFLKVQDSDEIDKIVHALNKEISSKIDCASCGNCCIGLAPKITNEDLVTLSKRLNFSEEEIIEKYTELDSGSYYLKEISCTFLSGKKCNIYEDRPHDCHSYPHLHKKDFTSRLLGVIDNYSVCPIVYNVFERLKIKLNFK